MKKVLRRRKLVKLEASWKKEALECNLFYFWLKWQIVKPNRNDCKKFKRRPNCFFQVTLTLALLSWWLRHLIFTPEPLKGYHYCPVKFSGRNRETFR